jgi:transcriptional regulator with GAF, ATPase, and Fis domain
MTEVTTWRSLLGTIISDPQEKQRLANTIGISPITLTRWVTTESLPRRESLYRLVKACPPEYASILSNLIVQEWEGFSLTNATVDQRTAETVPAEVYADVLAIKAASPRLTRFWSIYQRLVPAMLEQLDLYHVGVGVTILACTRPVEGQPVRSLRVVGGDETPPLKQKTSGTVAYLLGLESLAGYAVTHSRLLSIQHKDDSRLPSLKIAGIESVVACPVKEEGRIAGCLSVVSMHPDSFLQPQLSLIESYANLVALAFTEEQFYEAERIHLSMLPDQQTQHLFFSNFQERVKRLMNEATRNQQPLNVTDAEQKVWQQLEEELLHVSHSTGEESDTIVRS